MCNTFSNNDIIPLYQSNINLNSYIHISINYTTKNPPPIVILLINVNNVSNIASMICTELPIMFFPVLGIFGPVALCSPAVPWSNWGVGEELGMDEDVIDGITDDVDVGIDEVIIEGDDDGTGVDNKDGIDDD